MADSTYDLKQNPEYDENIRKLQNSDPAHADNIFNPLIDKTLNNIHHVKLKSDELNGTLGTMENKVTEIADSIGEIQENNTIIQEELKTHTDDEDVHIGENERNNWNTAANTAKTLKGLPDGGAEGQVLAKNSDTDYDVDWVDQTGGSDFDITTVNPIKIGYDPAGGDVVNLGISVGIASQVQDNGSIIIGKLSSASSVDEMGNEQDKNYSITIGPESHVAGESSIAIGENIDLRPTLARNAIAIGTNSFVDINGVAIGVNAYSTGNGAVAIGRSAQVGSSTDGGAVAIGGNSASAISVGSNARSTSLGAIAFGGQAIANGIQSIALGYLANVSGTNSIAIGSIASANNYGGIAIGENATSYGLRGIAIGPNSAASESSIALGAEVKASACSIAIGERSFSGNGSISLGLSSTAISNNSIAIGRSARVTTHNSIAIGNSSHTAVSGIAIGDNSSITGTLAVAIGTASRSYGIQSIAIGSSANAVATDTIAIGNTAIAFGLNSVAIGANSFSNIYATTLGHSSSSSFSSVSIGYNTKAVGNNSVAIGAYATAGAESSIALGINASTSVVNQFMVADSISSISFPVQVSSRSDARDKIDIAEINEDSAADFINRLSSKLYNLNPRSLYLYSNEEIETLKIDINNHPYKINGKPYDYDSWLKGTKKRISPKSGFIAQEVASAMETVFGTSDYGDVVYNNQCDFTDSEKTKDGECQYYISYTSIIPFLVGAVHSTNKAIDDVKNMIVALNTQVTAINNRVLVLEQEALKGEGTLVITTEYATLSGSTQLSLEYATYEVRNSKNVLYGTYESKNKATITINKIPTDDYTIKVTGTSAGHANTTKTATILKNSVSTVNFPFRARYDYY